jgi:S1 RNA binding domain
MARSRSRSRSSGSSSRSGSSYSGSSRSSSRSSRSSSRGKDTKRTPVKRAASRSRSRSPEKRAAVADRSRSPAKRSTAAEEHSPASRRNRSPPAPRRSRSPRRRDSRGRRSSPVRKRSRSPARRDSRERQYRRRRDSRSRSPVRKASRRDSRSPARGAANGASYSRGTWGASGNSLQIGGARPGGLRGDDRSRPHHDDRSSSRYEDADRQPQQQQQRQQQQQQQQQRPTYGERGPEKLPEMYSIHKGEVVRAQPFGCFVRLDGYRKQGMVHISQIADHRVERVEDVIKEGETCWVKVSYAALKLYTASLLCHVCVCEYGRVLSFVARARFQDTGAWNRQSSALQGHHSYALLSMSLFGAPLQILISACTLLTHTVCSLLLGDQRSASSTASRSENRHVNESCQSINWRGPRPNT